MVPLSGSVLSDLPFGVPALDRRGERRSDPALPADALADPATRVMELRGDRAQIDADRRLVLRAPSTDDVRAHSELADASTGATPAVVAYLGESDGVAYVGVFGPAIEGTDDPLWVGLRQVATTLTDLEAALFVTSLGLANWHRAHTHCSRCGAKTVPAQSGWVRRCPSDESLHFPRTDPAVIMTVVDADDRVLLARGVGFTAKGMSTLAGFVEPGETLAAAVAREVREEVGVEVTDVTYLGDQPWPFPSSLMVGFSARAVGTELDLRDGEIEAARWFSRDELVAALASGEVVISPRLSISRALIEHWFGGPIDSPEVSLRRS